VLWRPVTEAPSANTYQAPPSQERELLPSAPQSGATGKRSPSPRASDFISGRCADTPSDARVRGGLSQRARTAAHSRCELGLSPCACLHVVNQLGR
jgi:hypothetical protein